MFDDAEILPDLPRPRWPLHPAPHSFERLENYVRRLAECYGTTLATFCRYGLGGEVHEVGVLTDTPPLPTLERLSAGTGVPVRHFRNMTSERCHARMTVALRRLVQQHPELVHKGFREVSGQAPFMDSI